MTASSLRRSPFGLRRSARDPWQQPGTRMRPEPRGPRFALPPARLSGRGACASSPTRQPSAAAPPRLPHDPTTTTLTTLTTTIPATTTTVRSAWGGDTSPAASFPARLQAGRSRRLPDTGRPAWPWGSSPPLRAQPYSAGHRLGSHRAPGVQSPGLPGLVLPPGRGSPPCARRRTVAGGLSAEASRRKACHTPSLTARACCGVAVAGPPPGFKAPVWQPQRLPRASPRANTRGACVRTP